MAILIESRHFLPSTSVRKNVLNKTLTDYQNHQPIDARELNDAEFEHFVRRIQPFSFEIGVRRFIKGLISPQKR